MNEIKRFESQKVLKIGIFRYLIPTLPLSQFNNLRIEKLKTTKMRKKEPINFLAFRKKQRKHHHFFAIFLLVIEELNE